MLRRSLTRFAALLCLSAIVFAKVPRPLAQVTIKTPDRRNIDLRKYRGKIVFLVLFLTDCDDCIAMVNVASKMERDFGARGFQVIGAAVNDKAPYLVTPFIQRYRPTFPVGFLDNKDDIIRILDLGPGVRPVAPMVMFIDQSGNVRFQYSAKDGAMMAEKNLRVIAEGLIRQRDEHAAPQRVTKQP